MSRSQVSDDDDYNDDVADDRDEGPIDSDLDAAEAEGDTSPCPYCDKPIYDEAEICHHCGKFISREDAPSNTPLWILTGVIICILVVLLWLL